MAEMSASAKLNTSEAVQIQSAVDGSEPPDAPRGTIPNNPVSLSVSESSTVPSHHPGAISSLTTSNIIEMATHNNPSSNNQSSPPQRQRSIYHDDSALEVWRFRCTAATSSGSSVNTLQYELSDDFRQKQVEVLGRKYGGALRARHAAIIIQRAYRKYCLQKKFNKLRRSHALPGSRTMQRYNTCLGGSMNRTSTSQSHASRGVNAAGVISPTHLDWYPVPSCSARATCVPARVRVTLKDDGVHPVRTAVHPHAASHAPLGASSSYAVARPRVYYQISDSAICGPPRVSALNSGSTSAPSTADCIKYPTCSTSVSRTTVQLGGHPVVDASEVAPSVHHTSGDVSRPTAFIRATGAGGSSNRGSGHRLSGRSKSTERSVRSRPAYKILSDRNEVLGDSVIIKYDPSRDTVLPTERILASNNVYAAISGPNPGGPHGHPRTAPVYQTTDNPYAAHMNLAAVVPGPGTNSIHYQKKRRPDPPERTSSVVSAVGYSTVTDPKHRYKISAPCIDTSSFPDSSIHSKRSYPDLSPYDDSCPQPGTSHGPGGSRPSNAHAGSAAPSPSDALDFASVEDPRPSPVWKHRRNTAPFHANTSDIGTVPIGIDSVDATTPASSSSASEAPAVSSSMASSGISDFSPQGNLATALSRSLPERAFLAQAESQNLTPTPDGETSNTIQRCRYDDDDDYASVSRTTYAVMPGLGRTVTTTITSKGPDSKRLSEADRKRQYRIALNFFNKKPERGIELAIGFNFVDPTPVAVSKFLQERKGLSKQMIGEYLGNLQNPFNDAVLRCFVNDVDFTGLPIDGALRRFQSLFRLPGEAQKIEKIMEVFAGRYCECNPAIAKQFKNQDTIFILAFAIIMLNTDLHSPNVKPDRKMKLEDFVKNLKGIDGGEDVDSNLLSGVYHRIKESEFRSGADHVSQVMKVDRTVVGKKPQLAVSHRRLVCYCRLYEVIDPHKKQGANAHQREVFLFNDMILITKMLSKKKTNVTYSYRNSHSLVGMQVHGFRTQYYVNGIGITHTLENKSLFFNARHEDDRLKFLEDLKESILESDEMEALRIEAALEKQKWCILPATSVANNGTRVASLNRGGENRDSGLADMDAATSGEGGSISSNGDHGSDGYSVVGGAGGGGYPLRRNNVLSNSFFNLRDVGNDAVETLRQRRSSINSLDSGMSSTASTASRESSPQATPIPVSLANQDSASTEHIFSTSNSRLDQSSDVSSPIRSAGSGCPGASSSSISHSQSSHFSFGGLFGAGGPKKRAAKSTASTGHSNDGHPAGSIPETGRRKSGPGNSFASTSEV